MQRFTKIPVQITAGVHELAITFVERSRAATEDHIFGFQPYGGFSYTGKMRVPKIIGTGVQVEGPFGVTGVSRTASRDKIFVCTPARPPTSGHVQSASQRRSRRARSADPRTPSDLERLLPFYENGRAAGTFDSV